ncbi:MAG: serine hydrolase [bacterium]
MQLISRLLLCSLMVALPLGSLRAESSIIVDNQTGRILEGVNANQKLPIASLTKLALAMVALDWSDLKKGNLDERATVPEAAISSTGGSIPSRFRPGMS